MFLPLRVYVALTEDMHAQNPYKPSPPGLGLGRKPEYPKELQEMFCEGPPGGYAWVPPKNPALLDFEDAEFVLSGRSPDIGTSPTEPSPLHHRCRLIV